MDKITKEGPDTGEVGEWDFGFTPDQVAVQDELAAQDNWWIYSIDWRRGYDGRLHTQITWKFETHSISMYNSLNDGWKLTEIGSHNWADTGNMSRRFSTTFGYEWTVKFPFEVLEQIDGDLHEWGRIITNIKYVGKTLDQI